MLEDKIKTVDQKLTKIISGGSRNRLNFNVQTFRTKGGDVINVWWGGGARALKLNTYSM